MTAPVGAELAKLEQEAKRKLQAVGNTASLEQWRVQYIGRKGALTKLLRRIKDLPVDQKQATGKQGNKLRRELKTAFADKESSFNKPASTSENHKSQITNHKSQASGHLHPLTAALRRTRDIFAAMGFQIVEGPDIDEAKYNFDQLNIDFEHPARAESDTFYLENLPNLVMRTHVSTLQLRGVIEHNLTPPFRMMYYGPSYRSEKEDATHLSHFQQYEFMVVDEQVNLADLKAIVQTFYSLFFGHEFAIRFRPAYYPFVEPGLDVDMRDTVTNQGGWLEMAGAGLVHPNVLRNLNVDPDKYQGIALGGGLDRLAMLRHNIPDARLLYGGDIRFLKQF